MAALFNLRFYSSWPCYCACPHIGMASWHTCIKWMASLMLLVAHELFLQGRGKMSAVKKGLFLPSEGYFRGQHHGAITLLLSASLKHPVAGIHYRSRSHNIAVGYKTTTFSWKADFWFLFKASQCRFLYSVNRVNQDSLYSHPCWCNPTITNPI